MERLKYRGLAHIIREGGPLLRSPMLLVRYSINGFTSFSFFKSHVIYPPLHLRIRITSSLTLIPLTYAVFLHYLSSILKTSTFITISLGGTTITTLLEASAGRDQTYLRLTLLSHTNILY